MKMIILTVRIAVGDQKLQHFIHGTHEEDEPQLCHCHGDETPQEDGRTHRMTERHWAWRKREADDESLIAPDFHTFHKYVQYAWASVRSHTGFYLICHSSLQTLKNRKNFLPGSAFWESVCSGSDVLPPIVSSIVVTWVMYMSPVILSSVTTPLIFTFFLSKEEEDISLVNNPKIQTQVVLHSPGWMLQVSHQWYSDFNIFHTSSVTCPHTLCLALLWFY